MADLHIFKSVHAATRKTLLKIKGFSEVKVEKVKEAIAKCQVSLIGAGLGLLSTWPQVFL